MSNFDLGPSGTTCSHRKNSCHSVSMSRSFSHFIAHSLPIVKLSTKSLFNPFPSYFLISNDLQSDFCRQFSCSIQSPKLVLGYMENLLIFVFYGLFLWMKVYWYPVYFHVIILYISIEDFLREGNCKNILILLTLFLSCVFFQTVFLQKLPETLS